MNLQSQFQISLDLAYPEAFVRKLSFKEAAKVWGGRKPTTPAIVCDHANEVPSVCECPEECYCVREGCCAGPVTAEYVEMNAGRYKVVGARKGEYEEETFVSNGRGKVECCSDTKKYREWNNIVWNGLEYHKNTQFVKVG